jgi:hypothetical protein
MNFETLIGKTMPMLIPMIDPKILQEVTIRGVEGGGIWIQSEKLTSDFLAALNVPAIQAPIFFVPFHAIKLGFVASDSLALSEEAFGV